MTEPALIEAFRRNLVTDGSSANTVHTYLDQVRQVARVVDLATCTEADIRALLPGWRETRTTNTVWLRLKALRKFEKWMIAHGHRATPFVTTIDLPKRPHLLPRPASREAVGATINAAVTTRDRLLVELLYGAGLRASEAASLDAADIDLDRRTLRVVGKGDKERIVPFGVPCAEALVAHLGNRRSGSVLGFKDRHGVKHAVRRITGGTIHPHQFRHSFATHLLAGGADIRVIQEMMGHADIETTAGYSKVEPSRLREVIHKHHPRGSLRLVREEAA